MRPTYLICYQRRCDRNSWKIQHKDPPVLQLRHPAQQPAHAVVLEHALALALAHARFLRGFQHGSGLLHRFLL